MIGPIKPFSSISRREADAVHALMMSREIPLSGYLAGRERGGNHVRALEDAWCETFGVKHAVACNSNTSGMLAACYALDVGPQSIVGVPCFTMSATAAAPRFLGATLEFSDVEDRTFCVHKDFGAPDVLMVTNLFGHPTSIGTLSAVSGMKTIEDNAQAPFAMNYGKYAGTIADIGVFSMNVHKPLNCGEGGMCVTNDDDLAAKLRAVVNHGEHVSDRVGLNLRMPEVCAAIALTQLRRGKEIIGGRVEQAESILDAIGHINGIRRPVVRDGCTHVYYTIPFLVEKNRTEFCAALREEGVPVVEGYVAPLYRMSAFSQFARSCPMAEDLHDRRMLYIENCAWDFTPEQIRLVGDAFRRAAEKWL